MKHIETLVEWDELCYEFNQTQDAHNKAFIAVNRKFAAIGQEQSNTNPTDAELLDFEKTRDALESVSRRMSEFVKKNALKD
jgi:hypothetical protein